MLYKGLQNYEVFWYEKPVFGQKRQAFGEKLTGGG